MVDKTNNTQGKLQKQIPALSVPPAQPVSSYSYANTFNMNLLFTELCIDPNFLIHVLELNFPEPREIERMEKYHEQDTSDIRVSKRKI